MSPSSVFRNVVVVVVFVLVAAVYQVQNAALLPIADSIRRFVFEYRSIQTLLCHLLLLSLNYFFRGPPNG